MSVKKYIISKAQGNFTIIPNNVLQGLKNYEALGLYCYIISLPPGWEFYKEQLSSRTGIGRDKINKLFKILEACRLLKIEQKRNTNGHFSHIDVRVDDGTSFKYNDLEKTESPFTDLPLTVNQLLVNSSYKRNIDKTNTDTKEIVIPPLEKYARKDPVKEKPIELPAWLPRESWEEFKQNRKDIKKPLTALGERKALKRLQTLKDQGQNPIEVLEMAIIGNWSGLFEVKKFTSPIQKQEIVGNRYANMRDVTQERLDREKAEAEAKRLN